MPATLATAPKRLEVFVQGQVIIPGWVEDLESFRRCRIFGKRTGPGRDRVPGFVSLGGSVHGRIPHA